MYINIVAPARFTPLSFITKPVNQSILQNERVQMECFVRSTLTPRFTWKFTRKGQSQLIVNGHDPLTLDYFIKLGERSQVLIIKEAKWEHEGTYQCIVSTLNDSVQAEAKLNVLGEYRIVYDYAMSAVEYFNDVHGNLVYSANK